MGIYRDRKSELEKDAQGERRPAREEEQDPSVLHEDTKAELKGLQVRPLQVLREIRQGGQTSGDNRSQHGRWILDEDLCK